MSSPYCCTWSEWVANAKSFSTLRSDFLPSSSRSASTSSVRMTPRKLAKSRARIFRASEAALVSANAAMSLRALASTWRRTARSTALGCRNPSSSACTSTGLSRGSNPCLMRISSSSLPLTPRVRLSRSHAVHCGGSLADEDSDPMMVAVVVNPRGCRKCCGTSDVNDSVVVSYVLVDHMESPAATLPATGGSACNGPAPGAAPVPAPTPAPVPAPAPAPARAPARAPRATMGDMPPLELSTLRAASRLPSLTPYPVTATGSVVVVVMRMWDVMNCMNLGFLAGVNPLECKMRMTSIGFTPRSMFSSAQANHSSGRSPTR